MLTRICTLTLVLITLAASSASAFNGNRRGFVLGGGLGFCPRASLKADSPGASADHHTGPAVNMLIGYGWSGSNVLVYDFNLSLYDGKSDSTTGIGGQGIAGPAWYHYFGRPGRALFTTVGLGFYRFFIEHAGEEDTVSLYNGTGILLGAGYEFARHFQVGLYHSSGWTKPQDVELTHSTWTVLLTGVAF